MNYTKFEPFLDQPARHFYEKKLHFGVAKDSGDRDARPSEEDADQSESNVYYTYISSCEETPRMPSFKSFSSITSPECSQRAKNKLDAANANVRGNSVEAKTIFSFHRFEQVDIDNPNLSFRESQDDASQKSQVQVTILSQTDLGDNLNSKIYSGMMKSMAINQLKKNMNEFYIRWKGWLELYTSTTGSSNSNPMLKSPTQMPNGITFD